MPKTKPLTPEQEIEKLLALYKAEYPQAKTEVKRYNSASIRVRIIDPRFAGMTPEARDGEFWKCMQELPDNAFTQITMAVLLAPGELKSSLANLEFEQPSRSHL